MFIDKIFKKKDKNIETNSLKSCPMQLNNIDELFKIYPDEYILKENETLVRIDRDIYIYKNNTFELLQEPISTMSKRVLDKNLKSEMIDYVDQIRRLILNHSLNNKNNISLLDYNFCINDILNYGLEDFIKMLESDNSEFQVVKEKGTVYTAYGLPREQEDIIIKW